MRGKSKRGARGVSERYARALLGVAIDKKLDPERIAEELREVASLVAREGRLSRALSTSTVAEAKRLAILEQVFGAAGLSSETRNLLRLLTENERMLLLAEISESFQRLLLEHLKIQPGDVVSAQPLTEEQKRRLAERLGQALGKTMELRYRSDPGLLGGLIVRIQNRVYDASVTTQLRRFQEKALSSL